MSTGLAPTYSTRVKVPRGGPNEVHPRGEIMAKAFKDMSSRAAEEARRHVFNGHITNEGTIGSQRAAIAAALAQSVEKDSMRPLYEKLRQMFRASEGGARLSEGTAHRLIEHVLSEGNVGQFAKMGSADVNLILPKLRAYAAVTLDRALKRAARKGITGGDAESWPGMEEAPPTPPRR
jgi:hypothetical protein